MERPILFTAEMVKAILIGNKTQTRRVIKPQPNHRHCRLDFECGVLKESSLINGCWNVGRKFECPYGQPGDVLWVREVNPDGSYSEEPARLLLRVKNVRVERVQDISQEDIVREGLWFYSQEYREEIRKWRDCVSAIQDTRIKYFARLWDSIYAKQGYGLIINPWVWVVEFEQVEA